MIATLIFLLLTDNAPSQPIPILQQRCRALVHWMADGFANTVINPALSMDRPIYQEISVKTKICMGVLCENPLTLSRADVVCLWIAGSIIPKCT
jgi:hypothetical protein